MQFFEPTMKFILFSGRVHWSAQFACTYPKYVYIVLKSIIDIRVLQGYIFIIFLRNPFVPTAIIQLLTYNNEAVLSTLHCNAFATKIDTNETLDKMLKKCSRGSL